MKLRILLLTALTGLMFSCATVVVDLPSVTDVPTDTRFEGRVIWHDLLTHTPAESQRFYAELFGWEFESPGAGYGVGGRGGYTLIRHNGRLIGGMIDTNALSGKSDISQWIMVVSVADVDAAAEVVGRTGGEVLTRPTDLRHRGRMSVVADAEGAVFALLETGDGDPPESNIEVGDFLWDELWSGRIDDAGGFYAELGGYDIESASTAGGDQQNYRLLRKEGQPRMGILANPLQGLDPVWVNYLRVEDPAAITARVADLGGRVLIEARDRDIGGQAAVIAGPSGAGIAMQTWPLD